MNMLDKIIVLILANRFEVSSVQRVLLVDIGLELCCLSLCLCYLYHCYAIVFYMDKREMEL